jgi:hypothetical protein
MRSTRMRPICRSETGRDVKNRRPSISAGVAGGIRTNSPIEQPLDRHWYATRGDDLLTNCIVPGKKPQTYDRTNHKIA